MTTLNISEMDSKVDGRQRLLDAAVNWLEQHSEADLRMSTIADDAGVTIALITHHFGSRDGLITAAQRVRVAGAVRQDIDFMREVLAAPVTADVFRAQLETMVTTVLDDAPSARRLSRMAALAAAHGRDELKSELAAEITQVMTAATQTVQQAQLRGVFRDDVDARALAALIQAMLLGFVLSDLDDQQPSWDEIRATVMLAFDSFLLPDTKD
jgi:AcrR family transcriptional regulator